jgi:hypothetical protein
LSNREQSHDKKGPLVWSLGLAIVGLFLLLSNFLLLGDFNILDLLPIVLVLIGVQVLLHGDFVPSSDFRTFGITRGSIESATLEINSGEIDVNIRALESPNVERLIAGQYAHQARPALNVRDVHAHLRMERSRTPWLSFSDWEIGISQDLPWQIVVSSYLGQVSVDLSQAIIQNVLISTGIGDIHLIAPAESFEALYVRSLLGSINLITPLGYNVRITVEGGRFFGVQVDENRYQETEAGVYTSRDADEDLPLLDIIVNGTFGDVYLS